MIDNVHQAHRTARDILQAIRKQHLGRMLRGKDGVKLTQAELMRDGATGVWAEMAAGLIDDLLDGMVRIASGQMPMAVRTQDRLRRLADSEVAMEIWNQVSPTTPARLRDAKG